MTSPRGASPSSVLVVEDDDDVRAPRSTTAPARRTWKTFLEVHWEVKTRRVHIAGIVHQPHGGWMMQVGRNLLDAGHGLLLGQRYLILDRDPVYTPDFRRLHSGRPCFGTIRGWQPF